MTDNTKRYCATMFYKIQDRKLKIKRLGYMNPSKLLWTISLYRSILVLSVILWCIASDYHFSIFNLFLYKKYTHILYLVFVCCLFVWWCLTPLSTKTIKLVIAVTKLGTYLVLQRIWNPIDFQGQRSNF
jgi:hypothetical protein